MKFPRYLSRVPVAIGISFLIAGCNLNQVANPLPDTDFREKRFEQMQNLQAFKKCRDEGIQLDSEARNRGAPAAFSTSARIIAKCVDGMGTAATVVSSEERMRLSALSIVNFIKGGDVETARRRFERFKSTWPDHDLYLAGGASFISTADALLGRVQDKTFGQFSAMNVNDDVKSEMRRLNHWKNR